MLILLFYSRIPLSPAIVPLDNNGQMDIKAQRSQLHRLSLSFFFPHEGRKNQRQFHCSLVDISAKWPIEEATQRTARKYKQQLLEERKQAEAERKQLLATFQKTIVELVTQRFPTLQRLAKMQVRGVKDLELLHQTMLHLALARDVNEAENVLFALTEKEEDHQA